MPSQPRRVYFVMETVTDKDGNYIPCIAVEGETGYYKTDWTWGKDYKLARECADDMNERLGICLLYTSPSPRDS